jgi:ABC-type uncharacterized transport system substrate-binding protein
LLSRSGATAEQGCADRISIFYCLPFRYLGPNRSVPARAARARVRGGENIVIEWRSSEGETDRLPALAAELVRLNVDVIVAADPSPTRAAKEATSTIPIVMTNEGDPVGTGFVASLARPGGNITGLATLRPEVSGKQLELLKEIVPKLSRMAVLGTSATNPGNAQQLREIELAADAFKVKLQYLTVLSPKDIETAFRESSMGRADAVLVQPAPSSILIEHRLSNLQPRAGSQLYTTIHNTSWTGDL